MSLTATRSGRTIVVRRGANGDALDLGEAGERVAGEAGTTVARQIRPTDDVGGLPHIPGFDGLRAIAVAAVVAYHLGYRWAGGGFLGVSLFFTLSGYLITSLLLAEHAASGRVSLRRFWSRRARRILPASLATLAAVVVAAHWLAAPASLGGDVRAALAQVANWRFVLGHRSYADLFATPSPLRHWWSLAIEEQLYLVLPVVAVLALRRGRRTLAAVLALAAAASVAMSFVLSSASFDRVYQGTDTRAVELLAGALAACFVTPGRLAAVRRGERQRLALALAFGALLAVWFVARLGQPWLRHGFGLLAIGNVAVVLAAATPLGAEVLGRRPLVALGRISYGVYLVHWPIVTWLTPERTGWSRPVVDGLRIAFTLLVAASSYGWIERPLREGRAAPARRVPLAAGVVGVITAASALIGIAPLTGSAGALANYRQGQTPSVLGATTVPAAGATSAGAGAASVSSVAAAATSSPSAPPTTVAAPPAPLLWVIGDSVPFSLTPSFSKVAAQGSLRVLSLAVPGCDGARGAPVVRLGWGTVDADSERAPDCADWSARWTGFAASSSPAAVLLMLGGHVVLDREIGGEWRTPCDAEFAEWYQPEVLARVDWVLANTHAVPLLTIAPWADAKATGVLQGDHRARIDCLNTMYRAVAAARPAVRLVDLQSVVCPAGESVDCQPWRPKDGLHYDGDGADTVARWLADQTLAALAAPSSSSPTPAAEAPTPTTPSP